MQWVNEHTMTKSMWTFRWEKHINVMRNILISICCDLSRKWDIMFRVSGTVKSISMPNHFFIPWYIATDDSDSNSRRAWDYYSRRQMCTKLVGFRHATMVPYFGLITYGQPEYFDFWINLNTGMDKKSPQSVGWNYLSIPIQQLHHFSLELDRSIYHTVYNGFHHTSMPGLNIQSMLMLIKETPGAVCLKANTKLT